MRILYVTTVGSTMVFFKNLIFSLLQEGHTVDIATNENEAKVPPCYKKWGCEVFHISCKRSPLTIETFQAVYQIARIVKERQYDIVHCHTPVASLCTRLACRKQRKNGLKVFYTAHGFHFYNGAPLRNWLLYYPVELLCSFLTDILITINNEDYKRAKKYLKAKDIIYVPGVGIDTDKFAHAENEKVDLRRKLLIPEDAFMLISVGELNKNKNHEVVVHALAKLCNKNVHYVVVGEGILLEHLKHMSIELDVGEQVHLLGQRDDVECLYKVSDVCILPSFREGLPVALMEAMASGLPCIVSSNRGSLDLIDENGGIFCKADDVETFKNAIQVLQNNFELCKKMGNYNQIRVKEFSSRKVIKVMKKIYNETTRR